ncbi:hypothetical protein [Streptomyces sp. NPDC053079]|uniref:hypothetical protein n=1 Tax=Streptomyces sp. NPDC053079 TaxID=3365697 RepID=UPI0037D8DCF1
MNRTVTGDEVAGVRATVEAGAAPRCTECRDIKAARRGAEQRGDRAGMGAAAARMGVHQRKAHA